MLNNLLIALLLVLFSMSCKIIEVPKSTANSIAEIKMESSVNYGIDNTGRTDVTQQIQRILDKQQRLVLRRGTYKVEGTIVVKANCALLLDNSVMLKKSKAGSIGPLIHLNGPYASVLGAGASSVIMSMQSSSKGIIAIGHITMDTKANNTLYNQLSNVRVIGGQQYGGKDKIKDIGIWIPNRQLKGANYFNTIENVILENVDIGIKLSGHSNANSISNITLTRVGDEQDDYGILLDGAQENRIYDVFHHFSPNGGATIGVQSLKLEGALYEPNFNNISHIISEPGGICKCADISAGRWNKFDLICNNSKPEIVSIDLGVNHCEYRRNGGIISESVKARTFQQSLLKTTNSKDHKLTLNSMWSEINCFDQKVIDNGYVFNGNARVKLNRNISKKGIFNISSILNFSSRKVMSIECALFINRKKQGVSRFVHTDKIDQQVTVDIKETISLAAGEDLNCQCRSMDGEHVILMEKENSYFQIEKKSDL